MAEEMPKNYDPAVNEPAILQKWLDGGYYKRREGVGDCTCLLYTSSRSRAGALS